MKYKFLRISLLSTLALLFSGVQGAFAAEEMAWNFSDWETKKYEETVTIDGLTAVATSSKAIEVDGSNKTVDGVAYTKRLKFGGTGSNEGRILKFDVAGPCEITIVLSHSSSSGDPRQLNICDKTFDTKNFLTQFEVAPGETIKKTYNYEGEATTICIGSANSGINLYAIYVTPTETAGEEPEVTEPVAELMHTASSYSGDPENVFTSTIDAEYEHVNNANMNAKWAGCAYADFSFAIPAGHTITSATLAFTGRGESRNVRNCDVMYANVGEILDYTETGLASGTAKVDLAATKITSVNFPKGADATTDFTVDVTDALTAIAGEGQRYIIFKFTGNPGGGDLLGKASDKAPQLTIETANASETTSYTVNFLDAQSNVLKEAAVYTGQLIGTEATASEEDMASFMNEDGSKKYIYVSGNKTITLVADATANVINLVFREAEKYSYVINADSDDGAVSQKIASGEDFEGATVTVPYQKYINVEGTLYQAAQGSAGYYLTTVTLNANNTTATILYTPTEITDVVYFSEGEDIEGMTPDASANANIRCSNGAGGYSAEVVTATTLQPGKYVVTANIWGNTGVTIVVKAGEANVLSLETKGYLVELSSKEIELTEATDITIEGAVAGKPLDYIYIVKTGDVATGIENVKAQPENGEIYNLQGQKVNNAEKGIFIINGKKVVLK